MMNVKNDNKDGVSRAADNAPLKICTEHYLIVKINGEDGRIRTTLSQNDIPFKEISIYSVEES